MSRAGSESVLRLQGIAHLLVDMDGVLFRGGTPLPGADRLFPFLDSVSVRYRLLTNNSTATPVQNATKLRALGINVDPAHIFTSALATGAHLVEQSAAGQRAYVVGEEGLIAAVEAAGLRVVSTAAAEWVVAGLDREVTYERLATASLALERGARFIASNADASLPVESGEVPGAGALQAVLTATTGMHPIVIGKPEGRMLELAMQDIGGSRSNTAMLGDRLDTDIEAAHRVGLPSILVLTGVSSRSDLNESRVQPDLVVEDLPHLMALWS